MAKSKKRFIPPDVTPDQALDLVTRADKALAEFAGPFEELESAIGMLFVGRLVGWKVLVLIHNKRTIRKYEEILGISIREQFPEEGPLVGKSPAYEYIKKIGNYWKAVSGEIKLPGRRDLES